MEGFYQGFHELKIFCGCTDEVNSDIILAGIIPGAIPDLTFNFNFMIGQIEKHQVDIFWANGLEGFDLDPGLTHIPDNGNIVSDDSTLWILT